MTTSVELISIVDCDLCVKLPLYQKVWDLPLPETWTRLSTILVMADSEKRWFPPPARNPDALDFEEVRVCRSCGTHYHYSQVHDPHFGEPREPETFWTLRRVTATEARAVLGHTGRDGVVEHLDGGWLDRQYETILGLLRGDLTRAPDLQVKKHMVDSLYEHYVGDQDWEGLRATLIECPDPAVGVYAARRIFDESDASGLTRHFSPRHFDNVSSILRADPTREQLLVAVLAGGLSRPGQLLAHFTLGWEPAGVSGIAMHTLRTYVPRQSLAPAIRALAAELQRPAELGWWREAARDLLMEYVGAAPERANEVLEAVAGDTDEALAVRTLCQSCLAQSGGV
jgi:hypothetical protein